MLFIRKKSAAPAGGFDPYTVVGVKGFEAAVGTGTVTVDLNASGNISGDFTNLAEDDYLVCLLGADNALDSDTPINTAGYVAILNDRADGTVSQYAARKIMGATPDTSIVINQSNNSRITTGLIAGVRGVNDTTPEDFAASNAANNSFTPPAVATGGVNTLFLAAMYLDDDAAKDSVVAPSNMTLIGAHHNSAGGGQGSGQNCTIALAGHVVPTATTFTPNAFTGVDDAVRCWSFSLQP